MSPLLTIVPEWSPALSAFGAVALLLLLYAGLHLAGKRLGAAGRWIATGSHAAAFGLSLNSLLHLSSLTTYSEKISFDWIHLPGLELDMTLVLDPLSLPMITMVTGITFLVHLFSTSYIRGEAYEHRYWKFLALFAFAMCGLVLSGNLVMMFIFWELVGVASYFLIGFWFQEEKPARASQKAFIVNRIGDAGFLVAIMAIFATDPVQLNFGSMSQEMGLLASIGIAMAAMGKSAQLPLQVWLPDAMAGPTPVSSLIHAATMVAAGIFLLLRMFPVMHPDVLTALALIGGLTALLAAISALTQTDIKRVLAFSTISQLGFMVMGIGVLVPGFAFFHLLTHAFFKCGLFLVAAAVIHSQHQTGHHFDAQDMRLMGGLRKKMPWTFVAYLLMAASLAGLPLFSGFLSKDGILLGALAYGEAGGWHWLPAAMSIAASALTAFYISRHAWLIFGGSNRAPVAGHFDSLREASWAMRLPLLVLAGFSLFAFWSDDPLHHEGAESIHGPSWALPLFIGLAAGGVLLASLLYRKRVPTAGPPHGLLTRLSFHQFYLDQVFDRILVQPVLALGQALKWWDQKVVDGLVNLVARVVIRRAPDAPVGEGTEASLSGWAYASDRKLVDPAVNGIATAAMRMGKALRGLQSGKLQQYLLISLFALLLLLFVIFEVLIK